MTGWSRRGRGWEGQSGAGLYGAVRDGAGQDGAGRDGFISRGWAAKQGRATRPIRLLLVGTVGHGAGARLECRGDDDKSYDRSFRFIAWCGTCL